MLSIRINLHRIFVWLLGMGRRGYRHVHWRVPEVNHPSRLGLRGRGRGQRHSAVRDTPV